jgi:hypothetical protein|nr:MAG TPA: Protein of unknown function (DUF1642) [Caudoviricetes sp.]
MNKQELIEKVDSLQYSLSWNIPRINKETVLDLINKLDEPQPLKLKDIISRMKQLFPLSRSEWIDEILHEFGEEFGSMKYREGYEQGKLEGMIEREKVKIPQFVADWIEECEVKEKSLLNSLLYTPEGVNSWVGNSDNQELFARAWLDGYEVEEEPKYTVSLKNGQPLVKSESGNTLYFNQDITAGNYKGTRKELEDAGFGEVFNSPLFEVEEVIE